VQGRKRRAKGRIVRILLTASMITLGVILALFVRRSLWGSGHRSDAVPSGTIFVVRLTEPLSSRTTRLGDKFRGRLDAVKGTAAVHPGLEVEGLCVAARKAVRGGGYLRLALSKLRDREGHRLAVQTATISVWGGPPEQHESAGAIDPGSTPADHRLTSAAEMRDAALAPPAQISFMLIEPLIIAGHRRHL